MATLLTDIGAFFTQAMAWAGDVVEFIVSNPVIFLIAIAIPVSGFAVGLVRRFLSL